MKKILILSLLLSIVLVVVLASCDVNRTIIDQSDVLPAETTGHISLPLDSQKDIFVGYHALTRFAAEFTDDKEIKRVKGKSVSDIKLTDSERSEIYGDDDDKDYTDEEFRDVSSDDVINLAEANEAAADDGGLLSTIFVALGNKALSSLSKFVGDTISDYVKGFFLEIFASRYSAQATKLDLVYSKLEDMEDSLSKISDEIRKLSYWQKFNDIYEKMSDIRLSVASLDGALVEVLGDAAIWNEMASDNQKAKEYVKEAFSDAGINPDQLMKDVKNVLSSMKGNPAVNNHNYYEITDFVVRKTMPWEEQGFTLRETIRSADCCALQDAVTALNLYWNVVKGAGGKTALSQLNSLFADYLKILENTPVDYSDYNRNYAVCNIDNASVKVAKKQKFSETLIPITYQICYSFHTHIAGASGPGPNYNWVYSYPSSYKKNTELHDHPEYFYNFKLDDIKNNPSTYKYLDVMRDPAVYPSFYYLCVTQAESVAKKMAKQEYFSKYAIAAISNYYSGIDDSNKNLTLDSLSPTDPAVIQNADKLKKNNFLYGLVDGGVFDADDIVSWYGKTTRQVLNDCGIADEHIASTFNYRAPEHDVAVLFKEGKAFFKTSNGSKNSDFIWYSMYRTSDGTLYDGFDTKTEKADLRDRQNLVMEMCNINYLNEYITAATYDIWRHYFHPIITFETYELKGDLK